MSAPTDAEGRLRVLCDDARVWLPEDVKADIRAVLGLLHEKERCPDHPGSALELVCVDCFESDRTADANERADAAERRVGELEEDVSRRSKLYNELVEETDERIKNQDIGWRGADKRAAAAERALAEMTTARDAWIVLQRGSMKRMAERDAALPAFLAKLRGLPRYFRWNAEASGVVKGNDLDALIHEVERGK